MGKKSRDKGKRGELELAGKLREYGYDAHRGAQYKGGAGSPDVVGLPGIHIEVKREERFAMWDALEQSQRDTGAGELSTVFHRKNNRPWVVVMPMDDFMVLYREANK